MRSFVNRVGLVDWSHVINENSVNQAYTLFVDKLTHIYDLCFPVHHVNIKFKSNRIPRKPWITSAILTSIRRKNNLYLKFTDSNKLLSCKLQE